MTKFDSEARNIGDKRLNDRKRQCLLICRSYIQELGLKISLKALDEEAMPYLCDYELADNVSLPAVLQEFEAAFEAKFNRKPTISKRKQMSDLDKFCTPAGAKRLQKKPVVVNDENKDSAQISCDSLQVVGSTIDSQQKYVSANTSAPLASFSVPSLLEGSIELRDLAQTLVASSLSRAASVEWTDIVGLDGAKSLLQEAVFLPLKYPHLFSGSVLQPWRSILLFGPPGTGKTMLAKALAGSTASHFLSVSPSSLLSKWRGDSEKLVMCLFALIQHNKPCVLFIDEIDAILPRESAGDVQDHESTRRMRAEFLTALDGVSSDMSGVAIVAATNSPWNLSPALLRRFEKRIFIDSPDASSRKSLLGRLLPTVNNFGTVIDKTEGWSGDDLRLLCKEAMMISVRKLVASGNTWETPSVTVHDIDCAQSKVRPACARNGNYLKWFNEFGSS